MMRAGAGLVMGALGWNASAHWNAAATPQQEEPPWLLGGPRLAPPPEVFVDPALPRGELREELLRAVLAPWKPKPPEPRSCSPRAPLCVSGAQPAERLRALRLLEQGADELALLYHTSLTQELNWSLHPQEALRVEVVELTRLHRDQGRAGCSGGRLEARSALDCLSAALLLERTPGLPRAWLGGVGFWVRQELGLTDSRDERELELAQAQPQLSLLERVHSREEERARLLFPSSPQRSARPKSSPDDWPPSGSVLRSDTALFWLHLAGRSELSPAKVALLSLGQARTQTPAASLRYHNEPELFDLLRVSLKDERPRLAAWLDDWTRLRLSPAELEKRLGFALPGSALAWDLPGDSLPRKLALEPALENLGQVHLRVLTQGQPEHRELMVSIDCEGPSSWVWSFSRRGTDGEEQSHQLLPFQERATHFTQRLQLEGASAIILSGTVLGGVDLAHPYDPDHAPHEPHACSVYFLWRDGL